MEQNKENTEQPTDQGTIKHLIGRLSICHDRYEDEYQEIIKELYELDVLTIERAA